MLQMDVITLKLNEKRENSQLNNLRNKKSVNNQVITSINGKEKIPLRFINYR